MDKKAYLEPVETSEPVSRPRLRPQSKSKNSEMLINPADLMSWVMWALIIGLCILGIGRLWDYIGLPPAETLYRQSGAKHSLESFGDKREMQHYVRQLSSRDTWEQTLNDINTILNKLTRELVEDLRPVVSSTEEAEKTEK